MKLLPDSHSNHLSFNPWPFFFCFLLGNVLLSYTPWPLGTKMALGVALILLPGWVAFRALSKSTPAPDEGTDVLPDPSVALFLAFGALFLFAQFFHLTQNPYWPTMDDSREDYFGWRLSQHWEGRMLWGESQVQPGYLWIVAGLLRFFKPTLTLFDAVPAVLFVLTIFAAFWAARRLFGRGFSLYAAALLAFSFAPYTLSRIHQRAALILLVECVLVGLLALHFREPDRHPLRPLLVGLVVGLGLYSYTSFAAVALWTGILFLLAAFRCGKWRQALLAGGSALVVFFPLLRAYWAPHGTDYYAGCFDPSHFGLRFFIALFWNGFQSAPYGPAWGGWFNPIFSALLFLGFLQMLCLRNRPWARAVFLSFPIFFLPALLTSDVELHRLIPLLPWGALLAALGVSVLAAKLPVSLRWTAALLLLTGSIGLDAYHYGGPYLRANLQPEGTRHWRVKAFSDAYRLIEERSRREGPGLVFHAFTTNYPDRSLEVYTYRFNALENPALDASRTRWVAVICNANHQPFLEKRFPTGVWSRLGDASGFYTFGLIPVEAFRQEELSRWKTVHAFFTEENRLALTKRPQDPWSLLGPPLQAARAALGNDLFLHTVFAEKANQYFVILKSTPQALASLEDGLQRGYPSATLYNAKGYLLSLEGRIPEARAAFRGACAAPVNLTHAAERLQALENPELPHPHSTSGNGDR